MVVNQKKMAVTSLRISGKISLMNNLKRNNPQLVLGFCLIADGYWEEHYPLSRVTTFKLFPYPHPILPHLRDY